MENLTKKTCIVILFCLMSLWVKDGFAQNNVIENSNIPELKRMAKIFREQYEANHEEAIRVAKEKGWSIRGKLPDGRAYELQGLDSEGMPIYYITYNINAANTVSTNKVWPGGSAGLDLTGNGMTVGEIAVKIADTRLYSAKNEHNRNSIVTSKGPYKPSK